MTKKSAIAIATFAMIHGFIDGHDDKAKELNVAIIAQNDNDNWFACFATRKARYFSVNPLWKSKGQVTLSTAALGPVVDLRVDSLETAVEKLNSFYAKPTVNNGFSRWHFEIVEKPEQKKTRFERMIDDFNISQSLSHINLIEATA